MTDEPSTAVAFADRIADLLSAAAGWILIALGGFAVASVVLRVVSPSTPNDPVASAFVLAFGLVFLVCGTVLEPSIRRRLARRHERTAFGRARRVDHRVVRGDRSGRDVGPDIPTGTSCADCGRSIEAGLDTRFREEYVVAGVPLYTVEEGHNYYCAECAVEDSPVADLRATRSGSEPGSVADEAHDRDGQSPATDESAAAERGQGSEADRTTDVDESENLV
jgi:hypothetical protein